MKKSLFIGLTLAAAGGALTVHANTSAKLAKSTRKAKTRKTRSLVSSSQKSTVQALAAQAPTLKPRVISLALLAYDHARERGMDKQKILTVVDFTKPSSEKRMWVFNLNDNKVMYHTLVAQGKGTGLNYAHHFSNRAGTDDSSIGVYETGVEYTGDHPYSMRLKGLEKGFNSNAYRRTVVVHPAWYATQSFDNRYHRLGRSWGCFALGTKIDPVVVKTIKNGTILFAYYPDKKWLQTSAYLKPLNNSSSSFV